MDSTRKKGDKLGKRENKLGKREDRLPVIHRPTYIRARIMRTLAPSLCAREKTRKNKLKTRKIAFDTDRSVDNFSLDKKPTGPPRGAVLKPLRGSPPRYAPPAAAGSQTWGHAPRPPWRASPPPLPSQRFPLPPCHPKGRGVIVEWAKKGVNRRFQPFF